jgi:hypothetical protein
MELTRSDIQEALRKLMRERREVVKFAEDSAASGGRETQPSHGANTAAGKRALGGAEEVPALAGLGSRANIKAPTSGGGFRR